MVKSESLTSPTRLSRLRAQGYCNYSDEDLSDLAFGNRFALILCSTIVAIGVITASIPTLAAMMVIALFGVILPYHPFDYIYNYAIRNFVNKPELPPRSRQATFACGIATIWLAATICLFYTNYSITGYISGGLLFSVAFLVSTTDYCIPSLIYNFLFKVKVI